MERHEFSVAKVIITGRVMDDPRESKYTGAAAGCVRFSVRFISRWDKSREKIVPVYSSIPICCEYDGARGTGRRAIHAEKNNRVYIEGKLATRKIHGPDGIETGNVAVEVVADVFAFL